jgi:hypothetical protein
MTTDLVLDDSSSPSPLVRLETARRLLAEVRGVDDARAIRDVAEAARIYARQARLGLEAQNDAAEIKLRAERKLGELLAQSERNPGGNANRPGCTTLAFPEANRHAGRRSPPCLRQSSIGTSPMSASKAAATARRN